MLSLSAPHFRGLTCSSVSPTVSRAADLAGLLPSSSCTAVDKAAESQPWHEYHHATTHHNSRPKGRWKRTGDRRTEERAGRRHEVQTRAALRHGQASLGAAWEEHNRDAVLQLSRVATHSSGVRSGTYPAQQDEKTEGPLSCTFSADAATESNRETHQRVITGNLTWQK